MTESFSTGPWPPGFDMGGDTQFRSQDYCQPPAWPTPPEKYEGNNPDGANQKPEEKNGENGKQPEVLYKQRALQWISNHPIYYEAADLKIMKLEDDDALALDVIFQIIHLRTDETPAEISFGLLRKIAIVSDKYECGKVLNPWPKLWMKPYENQATSPLYEDWIFIAKAFNSKNTKAKAISKELILEISSKSQRDNYFWRMIPTSTDTVSPKVEIHLKHLPDGFLVYVMRERLRAIKAIVTMLRQFTSDIVSARKPQGISGASYCKEACSDVAVGSLIRNLKLAVNLFGSTATSLPSTTTPRAGSLFGTATGVTNNNPVGLFGSTATSSSLFGSTTPMPPATNNFTFGRAATNSPTASSSLFGSGTRSSGAAAPPVIDDGRVLTPTTSGASSSTLTAAGPAITSNSPAEHKSNTLSFYEYPAFKTTLYTSGHKPCHKAFELGELITKCRGIIKDVSAGGYDEGSNIYFTPASTDFFQNKRQSHPSSSEPIKLVMSYSKLESLPVEISVRISSLYRDVDQLKRRDLCSLARCSRISNAHYSPELYSTIVTKSDRGTQYRALIRRNGGFLHYTQDVCSYIKSLIFMSECPRNDHEFADETMYPLLNRIFRSGSLRLLPWNMTHGTVPTCILQAGSFSKGLVTLSIDLGNPIQLARGTYQNIGCQSIRKLSLRNIYNHPKNFLIIYNFVITAESLSHLELQFAPSRTEFGSLQQTLGSEDYLPFEDEEIQAQFGAMSSIQELFRATIYAPLSRSHRPYSIAIQYAPETDLHRSLQLFRSLRPGLETLVFVSPCKEFSLERLNDQESRSPYCKYADVINKHSGSLKNIALHESAGTGIEREQLYPGDSIVARAKALLPAQVSLTVKTDITQVGSLSLPQLFSLERLRHVHAGPILGAPGLPPNFDRRIEFSAEDISSFSFSTLEILHVVPHNWAFVTEMRLAQAHDFSVDLLLKNAANDLIRSYRQFGAASPALSYLVIGVKGEKELVFRVRWTPRSDRGDYYEWESLLSVESQERHMATLQGCPIFELYPRVLFEPTHGVNRPFKG
ncbi:hypothetical protein TWF703_010552 [Orbilia oligospora]|uniref:Uncharacterized protein n=1 Tax=Orbilia oligospora TaxID=2813651 RepID=A0A7C8NQD5_ORBOL|nr:hypothetical protein TWF703_010552 [Orbilia oligospora]